MHISKWYKHEHAGGSPVSVQPNVFVPNVVLGPVTIKPDGSVEIAEGTSDMQAAEAFWQCVAKFAPAHTHQRLIDKIRELAALTRHQLKNPRTGESGAWTTLNVPTVLLDEIDDELRFLK